jgi:hypothetical protein
MFDPHHLTIEVVGSDIVIKMPGTENLAIYHKPNGFPRLRSKDQVGSADFRALAWTAANRKARELGWID